MSERTAVANQIRGLLLEYGVAIAPGIQRLRRELSAVLEAKDNRLPMLARSVVRELQARLLELEERIAGHDRQIAPVAQQNEAAKWLMRAEGVGPIPATAVVARVGEAKAFHHGRQCAACPVCPRTIATAPVLCIAVRIKLKSIGSRNGKQRPISSAHCGSGNGKRKAYLVRQKAGRDYDAPNTEDMPRCKFNSL